MLSSLLKRSARMSLSRSYSSGGSNEFVLISKPTIGVRLLQLNRPKALNALNTALIDELNVALTQANNDDEIGAIVITGSEKAFAAGADIKEMKDQSFADVFGKNFIEKWSDALRVRKPIIAAVNGFALGGGCELAMMADILYAGEKAVFGQPEIKLGIIPGAGGTQRLTRAVGKAKAMELILTGRNLTAQEALQFGLVAQVLPSDQLVDYAVKTAAIIAEYSPLAVKAAKEAVNEAYESSLASGSRYERRLFHGLFGSNDQKEGMAAFVEKRKPEFTGK